MIDYNQYVYTKAEWFKYGLGAGGVGFIILMLFYDHVILCGVGSVPVVILFMWLYRYSLMEKRKWQLTLQFKDAMESLVSALVAGYSLENAVLETRKDLLLMYRQEDIIMREFSYMANKLQLKVPVETLMKDLGRRSGVEDIITFSEILLTAKKTGGNLVRVMKCTAGNIGEKIEMKREVETLVAGKKMESACMTAIPLLMIVYLRIFSPGFLDPLYHNALGAGIMTAALAVYAISFLWGQKIMKIQF